MTWPILFFLAGLNNPIAKEGNNTNGNIHILRFRGSKEDVSDIIVDITRPTAPMYTMIKPQKVHARVYEYQEDSLAAAQITKQSKGADPSMATLSATTMRTGNTQID